MGSRKLIGFGKNSYVVSVPKAWIEQNGLKKGDELFINEEVNQLTLIPSMRANQPEKIKTQKINVDRLQTSVSRRIISAYVQNFNVIEVYGSKLNEHIDVIRETASGLVALEIMEQTSKKVMMKDFLNINDISIGSIINRLDIIIRSMADDNLDFLENKTETDLTMRDKDVNKLQFVAHKIVNKVLENPNLSKQLAVELKDALFYYRVTDSLEKIADQHKRLNRLVKDLGLPVDRQIVLEVFKEINDQYLAAVKALKNNDKEAADMILHSKRNILNLCDKALMNYQQMCIRDHSVNCSQCSKCDKNDVSYIVSMMDKFKRLEHQVVNIAKAVMNRS